MRLQFILSEIVIGLRRNMSMVVSIVLVAALTLVFVGFGWLLQHPGQPEQGLLVRQGRGLDLPVRVGQHRRELLRR